MDILCEIIHGSKLYGTSHPLSDTDLRSVYIPTLRECYTQSIKEAIEIKEDGRDDMIFSLHKFLDMAVTGQPVAIEMLYSNPFNQKVTPWNQAKWDYLVSKRKLFLTKGMKAFLGFAKSLTNKYAVKAERFGALNDLIKLISEASLVHYKAPNAKIIDIWNHLPLNEFCAKEVDAENRTFYVVLSRKYRDNTKLKDFLSALTDIQEEYGRRVQEAKDGKYDVKSVSHAFRICYQLQQIALTSDLKFPLKEAEFLTQLKLGQLNFEREDIFNKLFELMNETEAMLVESNLPEEVNPDLKFEILDYFYQKA